MITALLSLPGWHRLTWPDGKSVPLWMAEAGLPLIEAHFEQDNATRGEPAVMRFTMDDLREFRIAIEACIDPAGVRSGEVIVGFSHIDLGG